MAIIRNTLVPITRALNDSLRNSIPTGEDWTKLTTLVEHDGSPNPDAENKIVVFLANLKHETVIAPRNLAPSQDPEQFLIMSPPLYLDLSIILIYQFRSLQTFPDANTSADWSSSRTP